MYELIRLSEHDYYMDCPTKAGLVRLNDTDVAAIDSGSDKDAAKKLLKHIDANGWKLKAVYITHSHADHTGGCKLLQDRTGCRIYAAGVELAYVNFPELEPMTLWGGLPFKDLQNKFLMAQPSRAEELTEAALPAGWEMLPLPGHCFRMTGFRTGDRNVFLADCLSSEETLAKYGVSYLWDPYAYTETLENVKNLAAENFIPAHAPVTKDIANLAQKNIDSVNGLLESILRLCEGGNAFEDLLAELFTHYGLTMTAQQYALIGSTTRSCLSALYARGLVTFGFEENKMLWKRA